MYVMREKLHCSTCMWQLVPNLIRIRNKFHHYSPVLNTLTKVSDYIFDLSFALPAIRFRYAVTMEHLGRNVYQSANKWPCHQVGQKIDRVLVMLNSKHKASFYSNAL